MSNKNNKKNNKQNNKSVAKNAKQDFVRETDQDLNESVVSEIDEVVKEEVVSSENNVPKKVKSKKNSSGAAFLVLKIVIALVLALVIVYFGFTCTVREGNAAIITRFGKPRDTITEAGLNFKLPWPFESVITYDTREQYFETKQLETLTKDKKNIAFQSYVVWRIEDPLKYHIATTKDNGSIDVNAAIQTSVFSAINEVMGTYNLSDLVSSSNDNLKTTEIQKKIYDKVKASCKKTYAIDVIDVSILRLSYPTANLPNILNNISAERQAVIDTILAEANKQASGINSSANAEKESILAEGTNEAAKIKAEAEQEVARIYAEAQEANIELFKFLKELDTIVNSVNSTSVLVVDSSAYPFNILLEYGEKLDENTSVTSELEYILTQLSEDDRNALIDAIYTLLAEQGQQGSTESNTESSSESILDGESESDTDSNTPVESDNENETESSTDDDQTEDTSNSTEDEIEIGGT